MDRTTFLKVVRELIQHKEFGLIANGGTWVAHAYLKAVELELSGMPISDQVWFFLRVSSVTNDGFAWLDLAFQEMTKRQSPVDFLQRFAQSVHSQYVRQHPDQADVYRNPFHKWFEDDLMHKAIRNMLV